MKNLSILSAIFFAAIIFTGCGEEKIEIEKPPFVKTQKVSFANLNSENIYSGTVKGRYETKMSFQVGGKIISRNVQVGEVVNSGKILMSIDAKDIVAQNKNADAQVAATLAQLNLAKSNLERYSELFSENAVAAATLENYQTQYDAAVANYNSAVAQSQQTKNALGYTNLISNASGVISEINVEVGQVVSAGQNVLTLIQTDELEVEINVPENKISEINIGQSCEINFWANNFSVEGRVREISPIADKNSRTFAIKISLPQNQTQNLNFGMTASATFDKKNLQEKNSVILPVSAIYQTENQMQVWIVENNQVHLKNISVKNLGENEVEVSGLNFGEIVVVAGVHKLREGQEVRTE